jgi:hypothetical protein
MSSEARSVAEAILTLLDTLVILILGCSAVCDYLNANSDSDASCKIERLVVFIERRVLGIYMYQVTRNTHCTSWPPTDGTQNPTHIV